MMPTRSYSSWIASNLARSRSRVPLFFADDADDVQGTENTQILKSKLASDDPKNRLIVTSIQKMSNVKAGEARITQAELDRLTAKRIVFIIDECHRSTFGDMLQDIRRAFPNALFFGFTGTPILDENQKKDRPQPWCSANACTATALLTVFATAMCWASTPTW